MQRKHLRCIFFVIFVVQSYILTIYQTGGCLHKFEISNRKEKVKFWYKLCQHFIMGFIPYVIEQVPGGERSYDLYSRLLKDRIIFLTEDVNHATASSIIAQMLFLEADNPEKDIFFYINSPGGSVVDGLAIYDTMNHIKCDVNTICVGMAASMGAFLLSGGTKGKRFALPNSEIMIHQRATCSV